MVQCWPWTISFKWQILSGHIEFGNSTQVGLATCQFGVTKIELNHMTKWCYVVASFPEPFYFFGGQVIVIDKFGDMAVPKWTHGDQL